MGWLSFKGSILLGAYESGYGRVFSDLCMRGKGNAIGFFILTILSAGQNANEFK